MSIAQVAQTAGVSQASVSRVINKKPGVSPTIVKAVRAAMGSLGYEPPPLDRRPGRRTPVLLAEKAGHSVGVLLLDNLYEYTPGILVSHLRGIELEAADHGLATVISHLGPRHVVPATVTDAPIHGLILMGSRGEPRLIRSLERYASVWLSSHHGPGGDTVLAGNHAIAKIAADYLLHRGHTHLAFLAVMSSYPAYPARAEAFKFMGSQAKARVEIVMDDPTADGDGFPSLEILHRHMESLIARFAALDPRPTGVFVGNDMMAAMAYPALRRQGITPGRDVDLVSCNNEQSYLMGLDPRPATIDIGAEMIGRRSVEQLLRKIRKPEETRPVQIAISPVLVEAEQDRRAKDGSG